MRSVIWFSLNLISVSLFGGIDHRPLQPSLFSCLLSTYSNAYLSPSFQATRFEQVLNNERITNGATGADIERKHHLLVFPMQKDQNGKVDGFYLATRKTIYKVKATHCEVNQSGCTRCNERIDGSKLNPPAQSHFRDSNDIMIAMTLCPTDALPYFLVVGVGPEQDVEEKREDFKKLYQPTTFSEALDDTSVAALRNGVVRTLKLQARLLVANMDKAIRANKRPLTLFIDDLKDLVGRMGTADTCRDEALSKEIQNIQKYIYDYLKEKTRPDSIGLKRSSQKPSPSELSGTTPSH